MWCDPILAGAGCRRGSDERDTLPQVMQLGLQHTYSRLPSPFHRRVAPARVRAPRLIAFNFRLAEELGFDSVWIADHIVFPPVFESRYPYSADGRFRVTAILGEEQ